MIRFCPATVVKLVVLGCVVLGAESAFGQGFGGGLGDTGGGRGGDSDAGSQALATIMNFVPAKEGQDNLLGYLQVKLDTGKVMRLGVRPNLEVKLGNHTFPADEYDRILLPSLAVRVSWSTMLQGTRKVPYVSALGFETISVEGQITKVDPESSTVRVFAKPKTGGGPGSWPVLKKPPTPKPKPQKPSTPGGLGSSGNPKPKPPPKERPVQSKSLALKYFDGASSISDTSKQTLTLAEMGDYTRSQFSASIAYGERVCVLITCEIEGEKPEAKSGDSGAGRL